VRPRLWIPEGARLLRPDHAAHHQVEDREDPPSDDAVATIESPGPPAAILACLSLPVFLALAHRPRESPFSPAYDFSGGELGIFAELPLGGVDAHCVSFGPDLSGDLVATLAVTGRAALTDAQWGGAGAAAAARKEARAPAAMDETAAH
jgi:hypothetical protein